MGTPELVAKSHTTAGALGTPLAAGICSENSLIRGCALELAGSVLNPGD